ncbi:TetR family transcriptional regulator [Paraburkholderia caballeronis]|uniref:TetR/AcrR family transcriptional regulator n=1 Tax=Paraburkholderia caballeronis TaxID=416943 RepID=UPI0010649A57|nr:TetR/AcrR family transcriptional regulator [Paraburkholderia caballeronis]TDV33850.1 TetR family transcriptional regulator [Paraburkholderia caballeronis]
MSQKASAAVPKRGRARRTQEERSDATQRRIVQSAMRLLHKKGIRGASLQDIAKGARVTLGALQHHFSSRQALMERLIDEVMNPLSEDSIVWPDATLPLDARARAFVRLAWDTYYGLPTYISAWSLFFGCKESPELFVKIDANVAKFDPVFFARFIEYFPEIGAYHANPRQFAGMVFATLRGMGVFCLFDSSPEEIDTQLDVLVQLIVQVGAGETRVTAHPSPHRRRRST